MSENPLEPIWSAKPKTWDERMAAHLLRRAGFGGTLDEIDTAVAAGPQATVGMLVDYQNLPNAFPELTFGELSAPLMAQKKAGGERRQAQGELMKSLSQEQRRSFQSLINIAQRSKLQEMKLWWLDRMIRTKRPLEEKMTLFWHGLFVSSAVTVRNAYLLYKQNALFREHAVGNYRQLTHEVSKDPAMLVYLNNNQNVKEHPNENYARELMELFTLGIGNYTEKDIKESARAFSGWTNVGDQVMFRRFQHDNGIKTFLGRSGNFDGDDIVDIIFQQPACSKYIATRLLKFFASDDPDPAIVDALAGVVRQHSFDMKPVLRTLFASQWFYSNDVIARQIKSPVQLVVGSLRALNVGLMQPKQVDGALKTMGQELFTAPTVKGWDGGRAWINTSTLFARYNLPAYLGTGKLPATGKRPGDAEMRSQYADFESGWNPQEDLAEADAVTTDAVVDLYIRKLVGPDMIDSQKRDDLIQFVNATGDARSHPHDPISPESEHRLRSLVHLIMSMAEYQLC
ncbi:MAG: DUF1800 domain-containing protein [Phycisphaerae bacterium]